MKHKVHFKDGSHEVYNFTYFFMDEEGSECVEEISRTFTSTLP